MNHQCEVCHHVFSQKAGLTAHRNRKRPCKAVSQETRALPKEEQEVPVAVPVATPVAASVAVSNVIPNDWINQVQLGDCIAYMKQLPANSIDMVCTDPPYFLDGLGSDWNKESLDQKGSSSRVGNLPKGMKFDRNQSKQFHAFYTQVSAEIFRVLKPGGAFLSFSSPRLYHSMAWAMEEAGFEIRDMLGWIYTQAQVKAFSQDHIIDKDKNKTDEEKAALKAACKDWKTPQLKPAIEPICLAVKPIEGRYIDNFQKYGTGLMNTSEETKVGEDYFPSNIIVTEPVGNGLEKVFLVSKPSKAEKGTYNTHLSVKPVALIRHLMTLFTKEGSLILDPFMGSGTTALACIESKRRYMGFDINEEYIKITERRIKDLK
jgi:site-specific DNA-methyltransferase (adenine-specific)